MFCRACSTRLEDGQRICPNCGRVARDLSLSASPGGKPVAARPRASLANAQLPSPAEVELYDEVDLDDTGAAAPPPQVARPVRPAPVRPARPAPTRATRSGSSLKLDPGQLRAQLAQQPGLLEPGLAVVRDEQGRPVGIGYPTDVGEIDLLARDAAGGFVVVVIADPDPLRDPVAEVLQRIGWVRKQLARSGTEVRGMVLLEAPLGDLSYTAAAVASTVNFKTWRVSLAFEDLDI